MPIIKTSQKTVDKGPRVHIHQRPFNPEIMNFSKEQTKQFNQLARENTQRKDDTNKLKQENIEETDEKEKIIS